MRKLTPMLAVCAMSMSQTACSLSSLLPMLLSNNSAPISGAVKSDATQIPVGVIKATESAPTLGISSNSFKSTFSKAVDAKKVSPESPAKVTAKANPAPVAAAPAAQKSINSQTTAAR